MDIKKFTGYFHDGTVVSFKQYAEKIEILMESAEIRKEWKVDEIALSNSKTISGKLVVFGIKSISVNDILIKTLNQNHDDGEILRLRIGKDEVELTVEWFNFPPKDRSREFEHIRIHADRVEWENIPNLFNQNSHDYRAIFPTMDLRVGHKSSLGL